MVGGVLACCMKVQTINAEYLSEFKIEETFSSFKTLIFSYCQYLYQENNVQIFAGN